MVERFHRATSDRQSRRGPDRQHGVIALRSLLIHLLILDPLKKKSNPPPGARNFFQILHKIHAQTPQKIRKRSKVDLRLSSSQVDSFLDS